MLEELCRSALHSACQDIVDMDRGAYVRLKHDGDIRAKREFSQFFSYTSSLTAYHAIHLGVLTGRGNHGENKRTMWLAWIWMNENASEIVTAYIKIRYNGDLKKAMRESGTFENLHNGFLQYFSERRTSFLDKTNKQLEVQSQNSIIAGMKKTPQSHGGVANLLKVLTKTMREQGNSIYTIAKVQYAVCMQAGIYIPEEFITDILVAEEIKQGT